MWDERARLVIETWRVPGFGCPASAPKSWASMQAGERRALGSFLRQRRTRQVDTPDELFEPVARPLLAPVKLNARSRRKAVQTVLRDHSVCCPAALQADFSRNSSENPPSAKAKEDLR